MNLTRKQQRFVDEYMIDLNATQAAIRAGYSTKTARQIGEQNLSKLDIKSAIEEAQKEAKKQADIKLHRIIEEYKAIAFSNITDFLSFDAGGVHIIDSADITRHLLPAIAEVTEAKTANGTTIRFKLHNKIAALDALCRVLGFGGEKENSEEKLEKIKEAVKDILSALNRDKQPIEIEIVGMAAIPIGPA